MIKEFQIRYGRPYKVVMAIVLPCFLIAPFIFLLNRYGKTLEEWQVWVSIFGFLGLVILLCVWLALQLYPSASLRVNNHEISISFKRQFISFNSDFSFSIEDIISVKQGFLADAEYFVFETRNPERKFQISATSNNEADLLMFSEAISEVCELINEKL